MKSAVIDFAQGTSFRAAHGRVTARSSNVMLPSCTNSGMALIQIPLMNSGSFICTC